MHIPAWLPYVAAGLIIFFSLSLNVMAIMIFIGRDPFDEVETTSWPMRILLIPAVIGIDLPTFAAIVVLICSFFVGTSSGYAALSLVGLVLASTFFYLFSEKRAQRKFDSERLSLRRDI